MMKLLAFLIQTGSHVAGWRRPEAWDNPLCDFEYFRHLAQTAERGKFDGLFLADAQGYPRVPGREAFSRTESPRLEPISLLSALSVATKRIGLIGTASTTYNEPYSLARRFSTLDHLSAGRAGWNIVTSTTESEAHNFGFERHMGHAERYRRAAEFVDVVTGLWDTWEDGAVLADKVSGRYIDPNKLHALNHRGAHFRVAGPLNTPRSPQGHPVLVQAGASEDGRAFAARYAEVIFTSHPAMASAMVFYQDMKALAAAAGRDPRSLVILAAITPIIGATEDAALALQDDLDDLVDPALALSKLQWMLGDFDLSGYRLDGPLPDIPATDTSHSNRESIVAMAARENLTIRQLARRVSAGRSSRTIVGSAVQVADELEDWYRRGAADGFIISPPFFPDGLSQFVDGVVPILQQRGLFRRDYEGDTLRQHLDLARPPNRFELDPSLAGEPECW
jgi:FMN-dependent oxidoreductase (nitrilotriacetate monooxygenase family)